MVDIILGVLGTGGVIVVIAFFVDALEKALGKTGLFKDIGNMMKDAGVGAGKLISGFIPGSKVEPEVAEWLEHLAGWENRFTDALIEQLKAEDEKEDK